MVQTGHTVGWRVPGYSAGTMGLLMESRIFPSRTHVDTFWKTENGTELEPWLGDKSTKRYCQRGHRCDFRYFVVFPRK